MYDDEDFEFFSDPSEYDEKIEGFKAALRASVRKEIMDELESLRAENAGYADIRKNWNERIREMQQMHERALEEDRRTLWAKAQEHEEATRNAMKKRFFELLDTIALKAWAVDHETTKPPKCNKCDESRRLRFFSPTGRMMFECCTCDRFINRYFVKEANVVEISTQRLRSTFPYGTYLVERKPSDYNSDGSLLVTDLCDERKFDDIRMDTRYPVFKKRELAEQYAAYMNEITDQQEREAQRSDGFADNGGLATAT